MFVAVTYDTYQWDSIAQRLADHGVHYRVGTTIRAGWEHWTLYLGEDDDLSAVVNSLEAAGNDTARRSRLGRFATASHDAVG